MPPKLRLQPHRGGVDLIGGMWLVDRRTGEMVLAGPTGRSSLHFDAAGKGYIFGVDGVAVWASTLLKHLVYSSDTDELFVVYPGPAKQHIVLALQEAQRRRRQFVFITISQPPLRDFKLKLAVWRLPQDGASCWVLLSSLHSALHLQCNHGKAGRWVAKWSSWQKFIIDDLAMPPCHFRHQVKGGTGLQGVGVEASDTTDLLEEKGISSHGCVGLMAKWGCTHYKFGLRAADDIKSVRWCFEALLKSALGDPADFILQISPRVDWAPPRAPDDCIFATIRVKGLRVDYDSVQRALHVFGRDLYEVFGAEGEGDFIAFVCKLAVSKKLRWLFRQIVWELGCLVDRAFFHRRFAELDQQNINVSETSIDHALCKYLVAGSKYFASAQHLSMALGASRVGQKHVYTGVVASTSNVAMAFPPQVPLCFQLRYFSKPAFSVY